MNPTYTVHWYNRLDITNKGSQSGLDESEAIWLLSHGTFQRQLADYYYWSVPSLHAESTRVFTIRMGDEMSQRRVDVLEDENRLYKAVLGSITDVLNNPINDETDMRVIREIMKESEASNHVTT